MVLPGKQGRGGGGSGGGKGGRKEGPMVLQVQCSTGRGARWPEALALMVMPGEWR